MALDGFGQDVRAYDFARCSLEEDKTTDWRQRVMPDNLELK
ncbi:MAG: hypothetical protein QF437_20305 [Planctomycetota bacterium]|nr:hypothetical protein [Planctomycetota bacterium]